MTTTRVDIPVLETERLVLRAPILADFAAYAEFSASEARTKFVGGPTPEHRAWGQFCAIGGQWTLRGYGRWIVADATTDQALGVVGLHHPFEWPGPELAWSMFAAGEGKGMALEAALAARRYAYEVLGWSSIFSFIDPANTRSMALGKRMGCTPDGVMEHDEFGPLPIWRHPAPQEALT